MAAVRQYRVTSDGVLFGNNFVARGGPVPPTKARDAALVEWLIGAEAIEEIVPEAPEGGG